jgi:hypothetical protein
MSGEQTSEQKMQQVIEEILTTKTFNLDIVGKIKEMREEMIADKKTIEELRKYKEEYLKINHELIAKNNEQAIALKRWQELSDSMGKEAKENDKIRYEKDFQVKRADEIRSILDLIFHNSIIRERVVSQIPMERGRTASNSGYVNTETHTKETEKEIK